jgi:hypothetical protein
MTLLQSRRGHAPPSAQQTTTTREEHVLRLFKAMVVDTVGELDLAHVTDGFVTNFTPTPRQLLLLLAAHKPLDVKTLFSVEERLTASTQELILKQVLHYVEVYGLNAPGLFNLEQTNGQVATITYVQGLTTAQLADKVRTLLYANAPVKDAVALKAIIEGYAFDYDLGRIRNNEMRVLLFRLGADVFTNGDDAVRYMCYAATDSALLIKSQRAIKAIEEKAKIFTSRFFVDHERPLAQVFHRHKNLILAAKTDENRGAINKISRVAKRAHVAIHEPLAKRYIAEAHKGSVGADVLRTMSVRDKFKFLNLLAYKALGNTTDAFVIRNGKVHVEKDRAVLDAARLAAIEADVLASLRDDLGHLVGTSILLDAHVDYGLPVSRKQAIGQLPFGTRVDPDSGRLSAGIYWENAWGASDLDLSAIDPSGTRTGWGMRSGYDGRNVLFSGDVTDASDGAMEFMTNRADYAGTYALFVNIFRGEVGAKFALVVGHRTADRWIEHPVLREVGELHSRGNVIGFVSGGLFVVYACRLNGAYWSNGSKEEAIVSRGLARFWTVRDLFDKIGIAYETESAGRSYAHDLTYKGFSYDKLEALCSAQSVP